MKLKFGTKRKRQPRKKFIFRKKPCLFCADKAQDIDYKDVAKLSRFVTERGKIIPRRNSGTCARHQRMLSSAIKRARVIALLPFVRK
ncbi:MAG: 30S ribosomal protein S18 [Omnitrophica bacterium]|nr:30S ribosomal protein S18 [Candidatus Omnitrophota bacterium]